MKKHLTFFATVLVLALIFGSSFACSIGFTGSKNKKQPEIVTAVTDYTQVADGTKYYVSTSGDDSNPGTSPEQPIKTLAKASALALEPGDGIFLKRGDVWKGEQLVFTSSGTKEHPVYLSAYGEGERPHITLAGMDKVCVSTVNAAGLVISSLQLSDSYGGLEINFNENAPGKAMGREYLVIEDITAHNMAGLYNSDEYQYNHTSFGLMIRSRNTSSETVMLRGLAVRNCYFYNCNVGFGVGHIGYKFDHGSDVGTVDEFLIENVSAVLCGQWGMHFRNMNNGIIRYCNTKYTGQNANSFGSCAFLLVSTNNVLVDHLTVDGHYRNPSQSYDGCGVDFEGACVNVTMQNSVIKNIDGCGIFLFDNLGGRDNIDILIDNCTIENFGLNVNSVYACGILLSSNSTGKISNCEFKGCRNFDDVPATRTTKGTFDNFVLENNTETQSKIEYEYDFAVDNNVQTFGTTYYYWEDMKGTYGSLVDSIKCKDGYLTAYYGAETQYVRSPDYIACRLTEVNTLYLKLKNNSTATKMRLEYTYTTRPGSYSFEFELPATGTEAELNLDLNELMAEKRGYLKDFKLYLVDGIGEISIAHIGIRV